MGTTTAERLARTDPESLVVYAAEDAAAAEVGVRRFATFAALEAFVERVVCSDWWDQTFPTAPVDVVVSRRSRSATFSAAVLFPGEAAELVIMDGQWSLEVILHELAHVAAGGPAGHGPVFRRALVELWRREAGIVASTELTRQFTAAGLTI